MIMLQLCRSSFLCLRLKHKNGGFTLKLQRAKLSSSHRGRPNIFELCSSRFKRVHGTWVGSPSVDAFGTEVKQNSFVF